MSSHRMSGSRSTDSDRGSLDHSSSSSGASSSVSDGGNTQESLVNLTEHVVSLLQSTTFLHGATRLDKLAQAHVRQFSVAIGAIRAQYDSTLSVSRSCFWFLTVATSLF